MKTVDVLRAARAKIEKEENWTQGTNARTKTGQPVPCDSLDAACWCSDGALMSIKDAANAYEGAYVALQRAMRGSSSVIRFNDSRTHAEVLAAFDRAIAVEEGK